MSTQARTHLLTAEEFYQLPDPIEGGKMELVRGEVMTCMPGGLEHGELAVIISGALSVFARKYRLGSVSTEVGFVLRRDPDVVRAPDVAFLARDKVPASRRAFVEGAPTLAIEIISPGELDREISEKVSEYLSAGVQRVWLVRPDERSVVVWHGDRTARQLQAGESLTSEDAGFAAEGFELPLAELFAE